MNNSMGTPDGSPYNSGEMSEYDNDDENGRQTTWGRDSTKHKKEKEIPIGQFQWVLEPRLGTIIEAENNDTTVHNFQNWNNTDGYTGSYNYLGNIGSPRLNRIYMEREDTEDFLFLRPLSYFREGLKNFRFTNTLSPITNLAYHSCGNNQNGEDRVRAYFASNINNISGIGFKLDYLYGRGYYPNSANSMFGGTVYGYYRGEKYNAHAYVNIAHTKMYENGGIDNDDYIENPQKLERSMSTTEMPTRLSQAWNRNHEQNFYFTHKYNFGYDKEIELPDSLKPQPPTSSELLEALSDSIQQILRSDSVARALVVDSLRNKWISEQVPPMEFIPVASIMHTMDISNLTHTYLANADPGNFYHEPLYGGGAYSNDKTKALSVRNTFGLAMREGFNKWSPMGITLYASHKLRSYNLLVGDSLHQEKFTENDISVGGELARTQGKLFHFNLNGEFWLVGPKVGDFSVDGKTNFEFKFAKKDTLTLNLNATVKHEKPDFFFRHYHSQYTWYDNNDLDRELRTRIVGEFRLKRFGTRLKLGLENLTNYTYFGITKTLDEKSNIDPSLPGAYMNDVSVFQSGKNIQILSAMLSQDLKFGPLHWDTELTVQKSSVEDRLPLPLLNAYTNIYLLFRIAKVLRVQLGGDLRYFTEYYAPDWAPSIQQFAVQDLENNPVKIGNYPIINAYANLHIKHCRIYVNVKHVNAGTGHCFLAPHYGLNPFTINFGISWNFFN